MNMPPGSRWIYPVGLTGGGASSTPGGGLNQGTKGTTFYRVYETCMIAEGNKFTLYNAAIQG